MTKGSSLAKTVLDELTYAVNGLAMQVQHELRPGHREVVYQNALAERIRSAGMTAETEKRIEVYINDTLAGFMYVDVWVEQQLVVECKAHPHQLTNEEIGQTIAYLAATSSPVGMLYNFGRQKLEFKRILPPKNIQEWHHQLYRCIWTPPGRSLPSPETITPDTPIRFSVIAESRPFAPSSVPVRSSVAESVDRYSAAGVSIDAGNRAVELMRAAVRSTYGPQVLAGIGAFGGLFDAAELKAMRAPVLVASTDGVGTKVKLAAQVGRYQSIGHDLVNHCLNDILVQGARPLFFLDYIAASTLEPERIAEVVSGLAAACRAAGCALLGGETAEMPGVYQPGEFDVAGTIVGVVEREHILPRPTVQAGDVLLGLRSSGPHTNGYSLIRKIFEAETLTDEITEALLAPHRPYLRLLITNLEHVKALAHLTGGGFIENIPRVLHEGVGAVIHCGRWPVLPIFDEIQKRGDITHEEMHRIFNMGIGMVAVVAPEHVGELQATISEETYIIGELVAGERKVTLQ